MKIGAWPRSRIVWLSVAWVLISGGAILIGAINMLSNLPSSGPGLSGVSVDPAGLTGGAAILLIPPVCLIAIWVLQRKGQR